MYNNCSMAELFPEKSSLCRNEQVCRGWHVKCFERSNRLDTPLYLYKNVIRPQSGGNHRGWFVLVLESR